MVGVRQIIEDSKVDGEDTHSGAANSDSGNDPGDMRELRPAEPEEADGQEGALDTAEVEAAFGVEGHFAVVHGDFLLVDA